MDARGGRRRGGDAKGGMRCLGQCGRRHVGEDQAGWRRLGGPGEEAWKRVYQKAWRRGGGRAATPSKGSGI
eukprot:3797798-Rhodomonas_salina.2